MVKTAFSFAMCGGGGLVTFKTLKLLNFFRLDRRFLLTLQSEIVFRRLERLATALIGNAGHLIRYLPVCADRHGMTLVTSARRGNTLPGRKHGTPFKTHKNRKKHQQGKLHAYLHYKRNNC